MAKVNPAPGPRAETLVNICLPDYYKVQDAGIQTYLHDALEFLKNHSWIYDFQLTKIVSLRMWEKIPEMWRDCLVDLSTDELNNIPYGLVKAGWPESLKTFLSTSLKLSLDRSQVPDLQPLDIDPVLKRGMNPKKQHEVALLSGLVQRVCQQHNCQAVVDVGSGLGYLGQVLSQQCGLHVLGLEGKAAYAHGATCRAQHREVTTSRFQSVTCELLDSEESFVQLRDVLHGWLEKTDSSDTAQGRCVQNTKTPSEDPESAAVDHGDPTAAPSGVCSIHARTSTGASTGASTGNCDITTSTSSQRGVCMVGLHCCGDLTPTMLRLFSTTPVIKCIVCVSCCYHRMTLNKQDETHREFPLSDGLKSVMAEFQLKHGGWSLSTYALRLAAQETRARWKAQTSEDHIYHTHNVAYRGLLECLVEEGKWKVSKNKRKVAHRQDYKDFQTYLESVLTRMTIEGGDAHIDAIRQQLISLHDQHQQHFHLLEPFTCLQMIMQPVLETFILVDRALFLHEMTLAVNLWPIFDEALSPRNTALISWKS